MAIFGGMNRKPVFGQIPGMGMMQPEMQPPQYGAMAQGQGMQAPPAKKPGFFSRGGGLVDVLGAFGDAFGDNGPVYAQGKQRQNELLRQSQQAEQQRQQEREDYIWKAQYERDNPKPASDQLTRYMTAAGINPSSDQGKAMYTAAATNEAYPERAVSYTDEQGNSGLRLIRSGIPPQQQGGTQDGATATNPKTGEKVVFRNGQWQPMGGGGSNVTNGFPGQ